MHRLACPIVTIRMSSPQTDIADNAIISAANPMHREINIQST